MRYGTGVALTLSAVQVHILSNRCCVDTKRDHARQEQLFTFMWNLKQNLESSGHQENHKSHTSTGRKFALVEGLSHDLVCAGSNYHVHFEWQVWHGQYSLGFKFDKLKSVSRVEIDQDHVDKKDSRGKGFAVGRLKKHNFCPASALRNRCCIDTKRCSSAYTQQQVLRWH